MKYVTQDTYRGYTVTIKKDAMGDYYATTHDKVRINHLPWITPEKALKEAKVDIDRTLAPAHTELESELKAKDARIAELEELVVDLAGTLIAMVVNVEACRANDETYLKFVSDKADRAIDSVKEGEVK